MDIAALRKDYAAATLDVADVAPDPLHQLDRWLKEAIAARLPEPTAMSVATADARGRPSSRILLLKGLDARGLVFFSNYASRKGRELAANPRAALLFHWMELERTARIEGAVEQVAAAESDAYFASRPLGSRIGAIASPQSERIADRAWLQARVDEAAARYGESVPRPSHWGGYRVIPDAFEFWQGRPSRLHDRIAYTRAAAAGAWTIERLAP